MRLPITLLIFVMSMLAVSLARSEPYAYVANQGSGTVSIIDTRTDAVTSTFDAGDGPRAIAASADGARLYIGERNGTLIERDLYEDKETARITPGGSAKIVRVGSRGTILSVVLEDRDFVALIDAPTFHVTKAVPIGGKRATHAMFSPDGRWIYADAEGSDTVVVIDARDGAVTRSIPVGGEPGSIAFLPDGSRAYVAVGRNEIVAIDVSRHAILARVKSTAKVGDIVAHPDGKRVFASAAQANEVQVLDVTANTFIASIRVAADPSGMAITPDGRKLYVACSRSDTVSVIDTSTYEHIADVRVGVRPAAIVVSDRPSLPRDGG